MVCFRILSSVVRDFFCFPDNFKGVSKGVSRGSVGSQLTGGQCFVEAPWEYLIGVFSASNIGSLIIKFCLLFNFSHEDGFSYVKEATPLSSKLPNA